MNQPTTGLSRRKIFVSGASLLVLSGCGNLIGPDSAPGQMYVLAPEMPAGAATRALPWQIAVSRPESSASLTTDRIAIKRGENFDYYANAQWTDQAPQLLQTLLVQAFEKAGAMGSVAKDASGVRADYILQSEIRGFEAHYDAGDAPPTIVVDVTMKLMSAHSGAIAAAREFRHEAPASANTVPAAVAAFDAATAAVLGEIVDWVFSVAPRLQSRGS